MTDGKKDQNKEGLWEKMERATGNPNKGVPLAGQQREGNFEHIEDSHHAESG